MTIRSAVRSVCMGFVMATTFGPASADVPATMVVSPGSTAVVQLEIEVTGIDGTEIQSDSRTVALGAAFAAIGELRCERCS